MESRLSALVDEGERIGVLGSPSSTTELALDILGAAATRKLVGELALFRFMQDASPHYALGQITEVRLRNIWHEDPTIRSLIRQRGRIDAISARQDTHQGQMVVSAVFREKSPQQYEPDILGTVPPTGTPVHLATDAVLEQLLAPYHEQLFYLGHVYGSHPKLPLWFKHFDQGASGAGEAYHIGIFGKTGSGKSVLAKMILVAYARYPQMALLVMDPQGEFAKDMRGKPTGAFALPLQKILNSFKKPYFVLSVRNLVLDTWDLFEKILYESMFFTILSIPKGENRSLACHILARELKKRKVLLHQLAERASFEKAWQILQEEHVQKQFYRSKESRARFCEMLAEADQEELFQECWRPVALLFCEGRNRRTISKALMWLLRTKEENGSSRTRRPVLVVDLSHEDAHEVFWNEKVQALVIKRVLEKLMQVAEDFYAKEEKSLNALVLIDEAHRLASREKPEDEAARDVRTVLVDAVRTTRKYGLGWMFISQTLSSLHPEILQQLRIFFFGYGLGLGQEFQALRQLAGSSGAALELYRSFRDPHASFDMQSRQYAFMTIGPVSPLSFTGMPLFFNAFSDVQEFLQANRIYWRA